MTAQPRLSGESRNPRRPACVYLFASWLKGTLYVAVTSRVDRSQEFTLYP